MRVWARVAAVTACSIVIASCSDHGAGSGSPKPSNASVGVVTYNIHQGWSPDDDGRVPRWQEMQEVLERCRRPPPGEDSESACVLLLQETIIGTDSNRAEVPTDHAADLRARDFDAAFHSGGGCFAKRILAPIVIGGDLNAAAGYPQLDLLQEAAFQPCAVMGVDHVLIRQAIALEPSPETPITPRPTLACADSWSAPEGLSDHPAVGAVVTVQY
jgi:hypothetical protein